MASVVAIIKPLLSNSANVIEIVISIILLIVGGVIAYKLGDRA